MTRRSSRNGEGETRHIAVEIVGLDGFVQRDVSAVSTDGRTDDNGPVVASAHVDLQLSARQFEQGVFALLLLAVGAATCRAGSHRSRLLLWLLSCLRVQASETRATQIGTVEAAPDRVLWHFYDQCFAWLLLREAAARAGTRAAFSYAATGRASLARLSLDEAGEDREVGVQPDALDASDAKERGRNRASSGRTRARRWRGHGRRASTRQSRRDRQERDRAVLSQAMMGMQPRSRVSSITRRLSCSRRTRRACAC